MSSPAPEYSTALTSRNGQTQLDDGVAVAILLAHLDSHEQRPVLERRLAFPALGILLPRRTDLLPATHVL